MQKQIMAVTVDAEDRDLIRSLNEEIENNTNLKLGVSLIVTSLIRTLRGPEARERMTKQVIAHKREKIRQTIMRAAERAIKKAG